MAGSSFKKKELKIGVLALQGDYSKHQTRFNDLKLEDVLIKTILIKKASLLKAIDVLVIPGGESTTLLKLLDLEFKEAIKDFVNKDNKKIFGTCAGSILLSNKTLNPEQESLNLINIEVTRNAYGRQNDSFIAKDLIIDKSDVNIKEVIFIRAPKISKIGKDIEILCSYNDTPVLVKDKNIIVASFHPELSASNSEFYKYLINFFIES